MKTEMNETQMPQIVQPNEEFRQKKKKILMVIIQYNTRQPFIARFLECSIKKWQTAGEVQRGKYKGVTFNLCLARRGQEILRWRGDEPRP